MADEQRVRDVVRDCIAELGVSTQHAVLHTHVLRWLRAKYPAIMKATVADHLRRITTNDPNRGHFGATATDDLLFAVLDRYRLYDVERDPTPIYEPRATRPLDGSAPERSGEPHTYRSEARDHLVRHLHLIEDGLRLYTDEDGRAIGVRYPIGNWHVDVLALDRSDDFVLIELKLSQHDFIAVPFLRHCVSWMRFSRAQKHQQVRGVIAAKETSDEFRDACSSHGFALHVLEA